MPAQRFESEELDRDTLQYLRTIREHAGRGAPGVYLSERMAGLSVAGFTPSRLPLWGLLAGIALLLFSLLMVWLAILHDPFNVALLATGLFFLSGWLIVAWLRCLIARRRSNYLGHFKYFDPQYFWHALGRAVIVTPLRGLLDARWRHTTGAAGGTVRVVLEDAAFDVRVRSDDLAEALEIYLTELAQPGSGLPLDRGYDAVARAGLDEDPEDRIVTALPEPHRARGSLGPWIRYPVVLVLFAGLFLLSYQVCRFWRDTSIYKDVKDRNPPDLRFYLADPRNTRHRNDVQQKLDGFHDRAAKQIKALPGEPQLTGGLASLLGALRTSTAPVLTMSVTRSANRAPDSMEGILGPAVAPVMASTLIQKLSTKLTQEMNLLLGMHRGELLGEQMTALGEITEGFAMLTIDCKLRRPGKAEAGGQGSYSVVWTVTLQADESAPKFTCSWKRDFRAADASTLESEFQRMCNDFPDQFAHYLRTRVAANDQP
jgi:hypothetical protein